ncbi:MAG: AAA family ATPase, partial [Acidimicrobiales bacterium]
MQSRPVDLPRAAVEGGPAPVTALARALIENLSRVIRGKPEPVRLAAVALLSGGHLLVEDVPGVGKTLLAKAMARSVGGSFRRIQATPDLLAAELTGVNVFHAGSARWEFRPGPLFANVVLVDELNRATPRTQSALLEAMEEHQISVDGETHPLPDPFFLVATQNPYEHAGTFPLVEGQLDRFALVVQLGHPSRLAERELLLGTGGVPSLDDIGPVCEPRALSAAMAAVRQIHCAPAVAEYVVELANATRAHPQVVIGASPRASLALLHAARAQAAMASRG